jgi:uncharacterized protein (TIGR02391 family)
MENRSLLRPLPRWNGDLDAAVKIVAKIHNAGLSLLSEPDDLSHTDAVATFNRVKNRIEKTTAWARNALHRINGIFVEPVIRMEDIVRPSREYPSLTRLDSILYFLQSEQQARKDEDQRLIQGHQISCLHQLVRRRCATLFFARKFDEAVLNAFKLVETELRNRIGATPDDVGSALVSLAMNAKSPLLVFSPVAAEQESVHLLFRGAIGLFKNPLSHRFLDLEDEGKTYELLIFASLLLRLLDETRPTVRSDRRPRNRKHSKNQAIPI